MVSWRKLGGTVCGIVALAAVFVILFTFSDHENDRRKDTFFEPERYFRQQKQGLQKESAKQDPHNTTNHISETYNTSGPIKAKRICSMTERTKMLSTACKSVNSPPKVSNLLVDEKSEMLFCVINKVASSMVKRMFTGMRGGDPRTMHSERYLRRMGIKRFYSFSEQARDEMLANYTKGIMVRHPLDRLRSAYYNKFVQLRYIGPITYQSVITAYRKNKNNTSKTMRFDEFAQYIIHRNHYDTHWNTYERLCHPCAMTYDFIIRLETMDRDMQLLEEKLGKDLSKYYKKTYNSGSYPRNKTVDRHIQEMTSMDEQIYKDLLDSGFGKDMRLFGYDFNTSSGMAFCGTNCC